MNGLHFAVVGNLAWKMAIHGVGMDDYETGAATAREYQSGVSGGALVASKICKKMRVRTSVVSSVGDDIYGRMVINYFDNLGIDSSLISVNRRQVTNLECRINEGKKDSLLIRAPLKNSHQYDFDQVSDDVDWFFVADDAGDLSQLNEILHQAFLRQAKAALFCSSLKKSDARRFRYLLEDVKILIVTEDVARQATEQDSIKMMAEVLAREVDVVVIMGKRQVVVRNQQSLVQVQVAIVNQNAFAAGFAVSFARKKPLSMAVAMACSIDNPEKQVKISEQSL